MGSPVDARYNFSGGVTLRCGHVEWSLVYQCGTCLADLTTRLARVEAENVRLREAVGYVEAMWAKPHRGPCGPSLKDAEQCLAGLEMEIDAVVEHARAALKEKS